jgi:hypothetical protein
MPDATHPETWRPIPDWEGYYSVSDHGRVRSEPRTVHTIDGQTRHVRGRILRLDADFNGRYTVTLSRAGRRNRRTVHRLVAAAFLGPCPPGHEVCHGDGDHTNNYVRNLRFDTKRNNVLDSVRHGTHLQARKTHCPAATDWPRRTSPCTHFAEGCGPASPVTAHGTTSPTPSAPAAPMTSSHGPTGIMRGLCSQVRSPSRLRTRDPVYCL